MEMFAATLPQQLLCRKGYEEIVTNISLYPKTIQDMVTVSVEEE